MAKFYRKDKREFFGFLLRSKESFYVRENIHCTKNVFILVFERFFLCHERERVIHLSGVMQKIVQKSFQRWVQFILAMTEREIKARYKNAVLGFLWIVINPLLQMIVIGVVFQYFVPLEIENYFLFLFPALLIWNFFSYTVSKVTPSFYYERSLIKKAQFPREAIPLSLVFSNFFNLLIALFLFILVMIWVEWGSLGVFLPRLLWLIPILFTSVILTISLSLLAATLNVFWRDVAFIVQAIMPLWFYATPVVYTMSIFPEHFRQLLTLNPMVVPVVVSQYAFTGRSLAYIDAKSILWHIGMVFGFFAFSIFVYSKRNKYFDDWL